MNRRDVLKGAALVTHPTWGDKPPRVAGSIPRMRPDQELQVALTRAGSGPAPASPVIVARRVIIIGPTGGLFVYSPSPAFDNLIASIAATSGTDPYGNAYLGGSASYRPVVGGVEAAVNGGGNITFLTATSAAGPYTSIGFLQPFGNVPTTILQLGTPPGGAVLDGASLAWYRPGLTDDGAGINALYTSGIKSVAVLPGTVNIGTTIAVPDSGSLFGCGLATVFTLANSSGAVQNIVTNATNANNITVANLLIDGNRANNAGTWQSGIVFQNPNTDPHHQVRGVKIQNCTGDGFVQAGRGGGTVVSDVSIIHCDGFGINTIFDAEYSNIDIGNSGIDGVLVQGGSVRMSNVKAWFSGDKLVSSRGASATLLTVTPPANAWDGGGIGALSFSLANGWGNGFHWTNISGASQGPAGFGGASAALTAQDNARAGFYVDGTGSPQQGVTLAGVEADSNNNCGTNGGVANGAFAGIDWGGIFGYCEGKSFDRGTNVCKQQAALNVVASSGFIKNRFRLQFFGTNPGALADGSNMPPLTAGSAPTTNDVEFLCQGRSLRTIAGTGTVAIDPFLAETFSTTVTGALTVSAPALTGTNTTGLFLVQGMKIALALTQDGVGGHAITLNAVFRLNGEAFSVVAGVTSVIEFVWDGTFWQAMS